MLPTITSPERQCDAQQYHLFNEFCCCCSIADNTMDKLQFLIFTFAVLLPNLCNVSFCNSGNFSILKMVATTILHFQKFKILMVDLL